MQQKNKTFYCYCKTMQKLHEAISVFRNVLWWVTSWMWVTSSYLTSGRLSLKRIKPSLELMSSNIIHFAFIQFQLKNKQHSTTNKIIIICIAIMQIIGIIRMFFDERCQTQHLNQALSANDLQTYWVLKDSHETSSTAKFRFNNFQNIIAAQRAYHQQNYKLSSYLQNCLLSSQQMKN